RARPPGLVGERLLHLPRVRPPRRPAQRLRLVPVPPPPRRGPPAGGGAVIWVGIDDTDTLDTPGTNQLARALARRLEPRYEVARLPGPQLLFDPRVPYTSKNGSASLLLEPRSEPDWPGLIDTLRAGMRERFVPGSDPGLCVTRAVPAAVVAFGRRCQREL